MSSKRSEAISVLALAAVIVLITAVACGGNDGGEGAVQEGETAAPATDLSTPDLPLDTPVPPVNEPVPGEIETEARNFLAGELGVDEGDFRLDSSEGVGWSDASLGCPQEGMAYAQVITPGYKLVFDLAGTLYPVHANADGSHMVVCQDGR